MLSSYPSLSAAFLHHLHLDSFPTRRSSDLQLSRFLKAGIKATKDNALTRSSKIILHLDFGGANNLYRTWFDEITERKDRKSTRLNSSHVAISYAVFCLKKKNN